MTKTIGLREANQGFAECIRAVEAGEDFVITRNGTPVAKLMPVDGRRVPTPEQLAAWERLKAWSSGGSRLEAGGDLPEAEPFDRAALHER